MIKKTITRRIIVASLALFVLLILYCFPTKEEQDINEQIDYIEVEGQPIFFIDSNNYVARTNIVIEKESDLIKKAQNILESLTINSKKKDYIPNGFKAIIPENTKINSLTIEKGLLKVDFSKELLNISRDNEEKLIESIIYSLTELKDVEQIMIFIEGKNLLELPNSKKKLPHVLDRSYGINKVVDIDKLENSTKTTIYYIAKNGDNYYNVPVTLLNNNQNEKIEIVINELKSNSLSEPNLISYLTASSELLNYEILENEVKLSFNNAILDDLNNEKILEEVKYSIALSLKDNYGVKNVSLIVNDKLLSDVKFA